MKPSRSNQSRCAFTLVELLVVVFVFAVLVAMLLPVLERTKRHSGINCANLLKQIGLSYRLWANDHGNKYPMELSVADGGTKELAATGDAISSFRVISNELLDPKILYCWSDSNHTIFQLSPGPHLISSLPTNFLSASGLKTHISYFVGLDASASHPNALLCGDDNFEINGAQVKPGLLELSTNSSVDWTSARHILGKRHFWNATTSFGNICLVDGSVQMTTISSRTNFVQRSSGTITTSFTSLLQATGLATNRLAIP